MFLTVVLLSLFAAIFIHAVTEVKGYYFGQRSIFITLSISMLMFFLFVLILRYLFLLWFSFMQQLEFIGRPDDTYLPMVSVLVPAFNEEKVIGQSLLSLLKQDYPYFEILVVDDGSSDRTYEEACKFMGDYGAAKVRVIRQPNRGKAAAHNLAISVAKGELVLCVDADSQLAPGTITHMVRHFSNPGVAAVAGNVKVRNRVNLWTKLQALEYIEGLNMVRQAQGFFRSVNIIPGPVGMFRRSILLSVGGYESDTFAEDADLTLKLVSFGYGIRYEPRAISYTEAPKRLLDLVKQRYRWTRGILQSMKKRPEILLQPWKSLTTFFILWYMMFEAVLWPVMNIFANVFLIGMNLAYGMVGLLIFWFLQLTLLDMVAAVHCIAVEEEDLKLVPLALVYRLFFILIVDVCKVLATVEEVLGFKMSWGKLTRYGTE
jgi:cellulose synthase/poly-beta-1,6-N-acetylglucosamine synthase-like glycosyltransferase